jgi:hypothetical protein
MKVGDIVWFKDKDKNIYCSEIKEIVEVHGKVIGYHLIPIIGDIDTMTTCDSHNISFVLTIDNACIGVYCSLNFEDLINEKSN